MRVYIPADICVTIPDCDEAEMMAVLEQLLEDVSEGGRGWDCYLPQTPDDGLSEGCENVVVWRSYDPDRPITWLLDGEDQDDDGDGADSR